MAARNHFEIFNLPVSFEQSTVALDSAYREVQSKVHPDRFAAGSDAERRVAMQLATQANEAYRTLKNPLKRAIYLLELNGIDVRAETHTTMEPAFLMQQLEWREAIEDASQAKNVQQLESLLDEIKNESRARFVKLEAALGSGAYQPAAEAARQLLFMEKLETEIGDALEMLESA